MTLVTEHRHTLGYLAAIAIVIWLCFVWPAGPTDSPLGHMPQAPGGHSASDADPKVLRVCADPDNLPYANTRGEGFDNAIAELLAQELNRTVQYYWQPQRQGFLRTTIHARQCDVVMNVPTMLERVRTTRPYYRSTYVWVTRRDRELNLRSIDDVRLRGLRIGILLDGNAYDDPPAQALATRQLVTRLPGATLYGADSQPSQQRGIAAAVAERAVDVAIVWGPLAGYYAAREAVPLSIAPVQARQGRDDAPFAFDMSVGVRLEDAPLHAALDAAIGRRASDIRDILRRYGVPLVTGT